MTSIHDGQPRRPRAGARRVLAPILLALFILLGWQLFDQLFDPPTYLLPSPGEILHALVVDATYYFKHSAVTIFEALLGFMLAVIVGLLIGGTFAAFSWLENMLLPYAIASQAVPIVAIAPLLTVWLGSGLVSKITMAALICFFPVLVNTTRGLRSVTTQQVNLLKVFGANRWQVFWKLRMPAATSYLLAGSRITAALAMIGAIVAEYTGSDQGIGYVIMQATYRLDTVRLFSGIFYAACGGCVLLAGVVLAERTLFAAYSSKE